MNTKIIATLVLLLTVFSWSCDSYLDVNHDKNVIEEIPDAHVILPSVEIGVANQLMGWDFGFAGAFWSQYWTQSRGGSQFKYLCEYTPTSLGNAYSELTAGVLNDLERIKRKEASNKDKGLYFIAESLSIFTTQIMTDIWGNIPYTEALKGDKGIKEPKFDKAKDIYLDLNKRIDALLNLDLSKASIKEKYDFIYSGDLNKWLAFANSLKLKLMIRVSETEQFSPSTVLTFVKSNKFITESALIKHGLFDNTKEGKRHPMKEFQAGGANYLSGNVYACKTFIDYLSKNTDPRLTKLFKKTDKKKYTGAFFGDFDSQEDSDGNGVKDKDEKHSTPLFDADIDLVIMSTWEVNFYIAEIYARNSDFANAKKYYEMGVKASCNQHKIEESKATEILNNYAKWTASTKEAAIEQIAMQKWVANANYQHIESFLERNRTKYPSVNTVDIKADRKDAHLNFEPGKLTISVVGRALTNGTLPASPTYPASVLNRNNNAPDQKLDLLEKIWWNKKVGN